TDELVQGGQALRAKVLGLRPRYLAVLGVGAYRSAFHRPQAQPGPQEEPSLGETRVWVLPNPSGLNAHYPLEALVEMFAALRREVEAGQPGSEDGKRQTGRKDGNTQPEE
ncbi:MAG: hypothetical protein GYA17_20640, partial [Chloroflexi bacterium]|nr:hypothetical protein [Chloroflexota bacterium]